MTTTRMTTSQETPAHHRRRWRGPAPLPLGCSGGGWMRSKPLTTTMRTRQRRTPKTLTRWQAAVLLLPSRSRYCHAGAALAARGMIGGVPGRGGVDGGQRWMCRSAGSAPPVLVRWSESQAQTRGAAGWTSRGQHWHCCPLMWARRRCLPRQRHCRRCAAAVSAGTAAKWSTTATAGQSSRRQCCGRCERATTRRRRQNHWQSSSCHRHCHQRSHHRHQRRCFRCAAQS